jgi:DNA-directed RNA polymerase beta' subunit
MKNDNKLNSVEHTPIMKSNNNVVSRIRFNVLSKQDILNMSVVEITNLKNDQPGGLYDPKMGPTIITKDQCPTCSLLMKECSGHFGHIVLNKPIFNPLFEKEIQKLLKHFCFVCGNLCYSIDDVENKKIKFDKHQACIQCSVIQPIWEEDDKQEVFTHIQMRFKESVVDAFPEDVLQVFARYNPDHLQLMNFHTNPKNFIIEVLPVLPPTTRPIVVIDDGKICDDDLTFQYLEIMKANRALLSSKIDTKKAMRNLYFKIASLFNNSAGKSKHNTNGKPVKGIKERLSTKNGLMRENLMGKRVEQSGRTVIGPDPTLLLDQLAVPEEFGNILSVQEQINRYNIVRMSELLTHGRVSFIKRAQTQQDINVRFARMVIGTRLQPNDIVIRNGRELDPRLVGKLRNKDYIIRDGCVFRHEPDGVRNLELHFGDVVEVHLRDNDYVLLNRQPTLHKGSMIALRTKVCPGKNLRFNLCITKSLNADFDGDEGNIHVPQKHNARVEMMELSSVKNHLLSQRNGQANIVLVQDNLTSLYLMSLEKTPLPREHLSDLCLHLVDRDGKTLTASTIIALLREKQIDQYAAISYDCISLCLPNAFSFQEIIHKGRWVGTGVFNKKVMSAIIQRVVLVFDPETAIQMINNLTFISNQWLYHRSFSIGLGDCLTTTTTLIPDTILRCFAESNTLEKQIVHPGIRESKIQGCLNKARDVGMKMAKDGLCANNNFLSTLNSGSKGDFFNIAQIAGCLGQQNFRGARIDNYLNHGTRSLFHNDWVLTDDKDKYEARGFIRHSFLRGLNPREAFFHSMPGREGITDTALGTGLSGYAQRRIIKLMEDICVQNDGTVRDEMDNIYQFIYGEMGLDCTTSFPFQEIADALSYQIELNHHE